MATAEKLAKPLRLRMEIVVENETEDDDGDGRGGDDGGSCGRRAIYPYPDRRDFKDALMRIVRKIAGVFLSGEGNIGVDGGGGGGVGGGVPADQRGFPSVRDWLAAAENKKRNFLEASLTDETLYAAEAHLDAVGQAIYGSIEKQVEAVKQEYHRLVD